VQRVQCTQSVLVLVLVVLVLVLLVLLCTTVLRIQC
jgi:hypothetical protein